MDRPLQESKKAVALALKREYRSRIVWEFQAVMNEEDELSGGFAWRAIKH